MTPIILVPAVDGICEATAKGVHCRIANGDLFSFQAFINALVELPYNKLPNFMRTSEIFYKNSYIPIQKIKSLPHQISSSDIAILNNAALFQSAEFHTWMKVKSTEIAEPMGNNKHIQITIN